MQKQKEQITCLGRLQSTPESEAFCFRYALSQTSGSCSIPHHSVFSHNFKLFLHDQDQSYFQHCQKKKKKKKKKRGKLKDHTMNGPTKFAKSQTRNRTPCSVKHYRKMYGSKKKIRGNRR